MRGNIIAHSIVILIFIQILFNVPHMESTKLKDTHDTEYLDNDVTHIDPQELLSNTPTAFTENRGQLENDEVRFYAQGGNVWFTDDGVWFELREEIKSPESGVQSRESDEFFDQMDRFRVPEIVEYRRVVLKQEFVDANIVKPIGREPLGYFSNFFYGNDSSKWCTDVPNYAEIYYENLYDGIDLRYYTNENGLKYDFILRPGADPNQIKIRYQGSDGLEIDRSENLVVKTSIEDMIDGELFIFQNQNKVQHRIKGQFKIYNDMEYGFELLDHYDRNNVLIIDPHISLQYSTFMGGSSFDENFHIDVDSNGNVFASGWTFSSNFPNTTGAYDNFYNGFGDAFIFKLVSNGSTLMYSTFIGGTEYDNSVGIAIDINGSAFLTGMTESTDFPTTAGAYDTSYDGLSDAYILKINQDGSDLIYSTFIGSSQGDMGEDIAIDHNGNAIVGGWTNSPNFPNTPGAFDISYNGGVDGYILKLNHDGSNLVFSTFIGGNNDEYTRSIEIDSDGNIYTVGTTSSVDFPVTSGAYDVTYYGVGSDSFCLKLDHTGSDLMFSTYLGGNSSFSWGNDLAIDSDGNVIIIGTTYSADFTNTTGAYDNTFNGVADVFVMKLDHLGSSLIYSTFIGGNSRDYQCGIANDPEGNVIITGYTYSTDFPITPDAYCKTKNNMYDAFISRLSANGSELLYSTFLGGKGHDYGYYFGFDSMNNVYMTGSTNSTDFPTTPGAFDTTHNGDYDGFVIKLAMPPLVIITSVSLLKNNESTNITYSKLCPYTLRTKITDNPGLGELNRIRLSLDPLGSNIQLIWNRITDKFSKINDPNNFIILEPSSKAYTGSLNGWVIDFNITFNWTYPDEMFHNVQVFASSKTLAPVLYNVSELFCVENDLVFNGTLSVKGVDNRTILNYDLVSVGEKINWTGLTVVYENTTDIYPPNEEYDVTIWNEGGLVGFDSPIVGKNFSLHTISPLVTDINGDTHIINLTRIPPECDKTNETFVIRIDGDNVTFSNPTPDNLTWQTDSNVKVSVNITDIGGGVVNGSSVMYSISIDNSKNWSNWKILAKLKSAMSIEPNVIVAFHDGKNNLIKWKAVDSIDNGPVISNAYRILVDTQNVTFSNYLPTYNYESLIKNVTVGITISDITSGVNSSTIEYAISTGMGEAWSDWQSIQDVGNGNKVNVSLNLTFPNGTGNRIKWRACDVAGNGPIESNVCKVKVNTWLPTPRVTLRRPENDSIIRTRSIELSWMLETWKLTNVSYDLYFDTIDPPAVNQTGVINNSLIINDLSNSETYYWTVIPRIGTRNGTCLSGIWSFTLEIPKPSVILISPANGSEVQALRPTLVWSVNYDGTEELTYDVYLGKNDSLEIEILDYYDINYLSKNVLEFNETYYWKVVPKAGGREGFESETWWFTVKPKDYVPTFGIELILEHSIIEIQPGETRYVKAIVTNLGEFTDKLVLSIPELPLSGVDIEINEPKIIEVSPNGTAEFNISVRAKDDALEDVISIIVVAASSNAAGYDQVVEQRATLTVKILGQAKHDTGKSTDASWYWIILLIIFVIIIVLFFVGLILKHKKEPGQEPPPIVASTLEPEIVGPQTPKKVPEVVTTAPTTIPAVDTTWANSSLPIQATPTPTPIPGQTPQPQIPQAHEQPQLPPADIETKEEKVEESTEESVEPSPTILQDTSSLPNQE